LFIWCKLVTGRAVRQVITLETRLAADRNAYFESGNRDIVHIMVEDPDVIIWNPCQAVAEGLGIGANTG